MSNKKLQNFIQLSYTFYPSNTYVPPVECMYTRLFMFHISSCHTRVVFHAIQLDGICTIENYSTADFELEFKINLADVIKSNTFVSTLKQQ